MAETIFESIVKANAVLNTKKSVNIMMQVNAKKQLDIATKLLLKGYPLDQPTRPLMVKYNNTNKVPDAKDYAGKVITAEKLTQIMEIVFPRIPHNHLILIVTQKAGIKEVNYISNGQKQDTANLVESLAVQLRNQKQIIKPKSN